jgi:hypothetical protein
MQRALLDCVVSTGLKGFRVDRFVGRDDGFSQFGLGEGEVPVGTPFLVVRKTPAALDLLARDRLFRLYEVSHPCTASARTGVSRFMCATMFVTIDT